ncbi:hypothetical protein Trydic_g978 [Trypoxylus dichotomus]
MYCANGDRVASLPVQVKSCKHVNQGLYAKSSMKWMDTSLIVEDDDELTQSDHYQHYTAHHQSFIMCALYDILRDTYYHLELQGLPAVRRKPSSHNKHDPVSEIPIHNESDEDQLVLMLALKSAIESLSEKNTN